MTDAAENVASATEREWERMLSRAQDGLCLRAQELLAARRAIGAISAAEDDLLTDLQNRVRHSSPEWRAVVP